MIRLESLKEGTPTKVADEKEKEEEIAYSWISPPLAPVGSWGNSNEPRFKE